MTAFVCVVGVLATFTVLEGDALRIAVIVLFVLAVILQNLAFQSKQNGG